MAILTAFGTPAMAATDIVCDRDAARALLKNANAAFAKHDYVVSRGDAARASAIFGACGQDEAPADIMRDGYDSANAGMLVGASLLRMKRPAEARTSLAFSYHLFDLIQSSGATPPDIVAGARQRMARLMTMDRSIATVALPVATPAAPSATAAPTVDYKPLAAWRTALLNDDQSVAAYLHVRVHVSAKGSVALYSSLFRVTTFSPSAGQETVSGLGQAAPQYKKYDYLSKNQTFTWVPSIQPNEDLGAMGQMALQDGDERTVVVTFRVRRDVATTEDQVARIGSTLTLRLGAR